MQNPVQARAKQAVTRCDGVLIKPTIQVEDQIIMKDGEFCIE